MSKTTVVRIASPTLWVIALVSALLSVLLSFSSANGALGYPGPIAGPGLPNGPSLGRVPVGGSTYGWVGGFDLSSQVCFKINGLPAGCAPTLDRASGAHDGWAYFVLNIGNSNPNSNNGPNCIGTPSPTAQLTNSDLVGPVIPIHMGINTVQVIGQSTTNGVTSTITLKLPFTVYRNCNGTTTTVPETTTLIPGSTTTIPGTTTTIPGTTTTTLPNGSTTTTVPSIVIGGSTITTYDPNTQTPAQTTQIAADIAAIVAIAAAAAAAASAAAAAAAAGGAGGAAGIAGVGARGGAMVGGRLTGGVLDPLDDGGELASGGANPLDAGGEAARGANAAGGTDPLDVGGEAASGEAAGGEAAGSASASAEAAGGEASGSASASAEAAGGEAASSGVAAESGAIAGEPLSPLDDGGEEDEPLNPLDDGGEEDEPLNPLDDGGEEDEPLGPLDDGGEDNE